ncbi:fibrillin-3-like [Sycon ciliatum]|uniref:fibrillin-3-like n=1 Tax=Sycon ciliatum TaxID=27933 RepID=UPI0031F6CD06
MTSPSTGTTSMTKAEQASRPQQCDIRQPALTSQVSQVHTFSLVLVVVLAWSAIAPLPATAELTVTCIRNAPRNCSYIGGEAKYVCLVRGAPNWVADIHVSPGRLSSYSILNVPGGQNVPFVFENVSLSDNHLTHCVTASTPQSSRQACFQVTACIPNILNCRMINSTDSENCTDIGMDVKYHCTARGPDLSLALLSPICGGSLSVQEATGGQDLFFTFRKLSWADNGRTHCIFARTAHEQQQHCLKLSVCRPNLDECSLGIHSCAAEANCSNTQDSFTCMCNPGFTGTGMVCQDLDECSLGTHSCAAEANCSNTQGSFMCMCNPGFTGTGMACQVSSKCDKIVDAVTRGSFDLSWVQPESGNTGAGVRVATGAASRVDRLLIGASGLDL